MGELQTLNDFSSYEDGDDELDQVDPRYREVYFGEPLNRSPSFIEFCGKQAARPQNIVYDTNIDSAAFHQYRDPNDSISSESRTLFSEYDNSFDPTTEATSFCSPSDPDLWLNCAITDFSDSVAPGHISAIGRKFQSIIEKGFAEPSPDISPHLYPECPEGVETVSRETGGITAGEVVLDLPTSPDDSQEEYYNELKRSVDKLLSEIVDRSGTDTDDQQNTGRPATALENRTRSKRQPSSGSKTQGNSQQNGSCRSGNSDHGSHDTSHHRRPRKSKGRLQDGANLPDQRNDGSISTPIDDADRHQTGQNAKWRPIRPKSKPHDPSMSVPELARPQTEGRVPIPRPRDGKFMCKRDGCGKRFSRPENLRRHVRTNCLQATEEEKTCPECGASRRGGRSQENLNTHMRNAHPEIFLKKG